MAKIRLVVLGTGFASFSLLKRIDTSCHHVTVVSPRNHFLFTPLLPSTTVGTIEFRSIIEPVRTARYDIEFLQASCSRIDTEKHSVICGVSFSLPYDLLLIGVGSSGNTYGIPGVLENCLPLKELSDARAIRQRIIDCFEEACHPGVGQDLRRKLLHFVVVGGGPTGVEFAAEMHDFLVEDLDRAFHPLMNDCRITVLEATGNILSTFDAALGSYTMKHFGRQRIEVRTGSKVVKVEKDAVFLDDGTVIPCRLIVWSTGIGPVPLVDSLPFKKIHGSRIALDNFLRVRDFGDIYAAGDCATPEDINLPATAQVAQQEGAYLARCFGRLARGKAVSPFRYKNLGMLAYVGSNRALADLASVKGHGFATWLFWRSAYITKLVSLKNRILVLFDWTKTFLFGRDISRF